MRTWWLFGCWLALAGVVYAEPQLLVRSSVGGDNMDGPAGNLRVRFQDRQAAVATWANLDTVYQKDPTLAMGLRTKHLELGQGSAAPWLQFLNKGLEAFPALMTELPFQSLGVMPYRSLAGSSDGSFGAACRLGEYEYLELFQYVYERYGRQMHAGGVSLTLPYETADGTASGRLQATIQCSGSTGAAGQTAVPQLDDPWFSVYQPRLRPARAQLAMLAHADTALVALQACGAVSLPSIRGSSPGNTWWDGAGGFVRLVARSDEQQTLVLDGGLAMTTRAFAFYASDLERYDLSGRLYLKGKLGEGMSIGLKLSSDGSIDRRLSAENMLRYEAVSLQLGLRQDGADFGWQVQAELAGLELPETLQGSLTTGLYGSAKLVQYGLSHRMQCTIDGLASTTQTTSLGLQTREATLHLQLELRTNVEQQAPWPITYSTGVRFSCLDLVGLSARADFAEGRAPAPAGSIWIQLQSQSPTKSTSGSSL